MDVETRKLRYFIAVTENHRTSKIDKTRIAVSDHVSITSGGIATDLRGPACRDRHNPAGAETVAAAGRH
jgi:hypothetical protein